MFQTHYHPDSQNDISRILIKIMVNRVSAIAQSDNIDLVSHVQSHLIVVNRKNGCVHISTIIEGVQRSARNVVIVE
jgi:hypothetical protein